MISRDTLQAALKKVRDDALQRNRWEEDSFRSDRHETKIELCEELAEALGMDLS
jgi:hypothetical protein